MSTHALRVLDRAGRTALQVLAGYLVTATTLGGVNWATAIAAVILAVVVALLQGLVDLPPVRLGWTGDALGRAVRTFAQTALGSVGAAVLITDVPWETVLSASALAAVTSLITSVAATPLGSDPVKGTPELVSGRSAHAVS